MYQKFIRFTSIVMRYGEKLFIFPLTRKVTIYQKQTKPKVTLKLKDYKND